MKVDDLPVDECAKEEKEEDGNDMNIGLHEQFPLRHLRLKCLSVSFDTSHLLLVELFLLDSFRLMTAMFVVHLCELLECGGTGNLTGGNEGMI